MQFNRGSLIFCIKELPGLAGEFLLSYGLCFIGIPLYIEGIILSKEKQRDREYNIALAIDTDRDSWYLIGILVFCAVVSEMEGSACKA